MFAAWVCELSGRPVPAGRTALSAELEALARLRGAVEAREARLLAAVDGLDDQGAPASAVARSVSRCSQREADRKARRAKTLTEVPAAADALAAGRLTVEHVDVLGRAVEATSAEAVAESGLVEKACRRPADLAAKDARTWTRHNQTDTDKQAAQQRRYEARSVIVFDDPDGMTVLHALFDPVTGHQIRKAIEAETNRLYHADGGREGAAEKRTPTQRRADALAGLLTGERTSCTSKAPVRNQMLIIATLHPAPDPDPDSDAAGPGRPRLVDGRLADGTPLPAATLARLTCGSDLYGAVFSTDGDPLWMGRQVRLATDAQWRALIARDGGCVICGTDPSHCEAHHLDQWAPPTNGRTDIDRLALACTHHHHLVHDCGWTLTHNPDGTWTLLPP